MNYGTTWQPSELFAQNAGLRISETDRKAIHKKLPQAEDGNFYVDAVFEGGGVKGTAFLGALRCFEDAGIKFRKVAGTSAGAITASMVAAGFTVDELEKLLGELDYNSFLSQKSSPFILNGSPNDDLKKPLLMLLNLLLVGKQGQYSSEPFLKWLQNSLELANISSFSSIKQPSNAWYHQRELRLVVSDITQKAMCVLPTDLPKYGESADHFSIAEAVRLSMSIPFFFEPGKLGHAHPSLIVDGGVLSNFPLWIFDAPDHQRPKCPTFGFRLVDEEPQTEAECNLNPPATKTAAKRRSAVALFQDMLSTMQVAGDRHYVERNDHGRIIQIGTQGVTTTQFDLTNADKSALYQEGYEKAKVFLLEQWSWKEHLATRGFVESNIQPFPAVHSVAA